MSSVSEVSRSRAGIAKLVTATRSASQTEESRVKSRFGNGSIKKSSEASRLYTMLWSMLSSSLRMPAVSDRANSAGSWSCRAATR